MRPTAVFLLAAAVVALRGTPAGCSVDEFQCACAYYARRYVNQVRVLLDMDTAAGYGSLASRMLAAARGRPDGAPAAGWLWLLNVFANTVKEPWRRRRRRRGRRWPVTVAEGLRPVDDGVHDYVRLCQLWGVPDVTAGWSQPAFEKYVLEENVTAAADCREVRPQWLYLNHVMAAPAADDGDGDGDGDACGVLARDAGVHWGETASRLRRLYGLSVDGWMLGTRELVLFQRTFLSVVTASIAGYVLVHVRLCRHYWTNGLGSADRNDGVVAEYSRVWMSVGDLLRSFSAYLDLAQDRCYRTALEVAADPALDEAGFRRATLAVETCVMEAGRGLFRIEPAETEAVVAAAVAAAAAAAASASAGTGAGRENDGLIELIALVDNNASAAAKYLKTIQDLLLDVDFKAIREFMWSTHVWLT